jgi:hypothetical protein
VRLVLGRGSGNGAGAVAHSLSNALKVGYGNETAGAVQRVAGLVPVRVVFAADDVQEVALGEAELVGIVGLVVVEGFYDL